MVGVGRGLVVGWWGLLQCCCCTAVYVFALVLFSCSFCVVQASLCVTVVLLLLHLPSITQHNTTAHMHYNTHKQPPPTSPLSPLPPLPLDLPRTPFTSSLHPSPSPSSSPQVCHVALEYTVPHMKLNSELMFGGLGKVVDIFLRYSHDPVALIAPIYQPFVHQDGELHLGSPVLTFLAEVYDTRLPVSIYMTADPGGGAYFFLVDADVFRHRTRGKIYTWSRWGVGKGGGWVGGWGGGWGEEHQGEC